MTTLTIFQIIIALLLIIVVIFQSRGGDGKGSFSRGTESYRSKKGLEKFLFYTTIVLAVLFASISIFSLVAR